MSNEEMKEMERNHAFIETLDLFFLDGDKKK